MTTLQKNIAYIEFINKAYPKRNIRVSIENLSVGIYRDDFGSWSGDLGMTFNTEQELCAYLSGLIAFYNSISHTPKAQK
jgi:hypothetical protein